MCTTISPSRSSVPCARSWDGRAPGIAIATMQPPPRLVARMARPPPAEPDRAASAHAYGLGCRSPCAPPLPLTSPPIAHSLTPPARPPPSRLLTWPRGHGPPPVTIRRPMGAGGHAGARAALLRHRLPSPADIGEQPAILCFHRQPEKETVTSSLCLSVCV
jgi:hypothetical protein